MHSEYTNALQNYDDMKIRLAEIEKKNQDALFESSLQLKELKTANALKDEEIRLLRQKLGVLQKSLEGMEDLGELTSVQPAPPEQHDIEEFLKVEEPESTTSAITLGRHVKIKDKTQSINSFTNKVANTFFSNKKIDHKCIHHLKLSKKWEF